jgi:hypothetical protein
LSRLSTAGDEGDRAPLVGVVLLPRLSQLSSTPDGVQLYTSLGFRERPHLTMLLGLSAPTETFL